MEVGSERHLGYKAVVFAAAIVLALLAFALVRRAPDAAPELAAQDALARLAPRAERPDVAVVALDDASVRRYGPVAHWPRALLGKGLGKMEDAGAKVVVMDLALDKRQGNQDSALWRVMADHRNVVLGMAYDAQRPQTYTPDDIRALVFLEKDAIASNLTLDARRTVQFPYYDFEPPVSDYTGSAAGVGVFDRETDADGILRDARLFYTSTVQYPPATKPLTGKFPTSRLADGAPVALPNLALVAALRVFQLDKSNVQIVSGDTVRLAGDIAPPVETPVDVQGRMRIRYVRPVTYSFLDILTGKVKPDLSGKVVFIGATAAADPATDLCATPEGRLPRVDVTASALTTLMDRSYVEVINRHPNRLLGSLLLLGLATGLGLMFVSGGRAAVAALVLLAGYAGVCWGAFNGGHLLPPLLPGFLVILLTYLISLALSLGPFRPRKVGVSPTYVSPPEGAVR